MKCCIAPQGELEDGLCTSQPIGSAHPGKPITNARGKAEKRRFGLCTWKMASEPIHILPGRSAARWEMFRDVLCSKKPDSFWHCNILEGHNDIDSGTVVVASRGFLQNGLGVVPYFSVKFWISSLLQPSALRSNQLKSFQTNEMQVPILNPHRFSGMLTKAWTTGWEFVPRERNFEARSQCFGPFATSCSAPSTFPHFQSWWTWVNTGELWTLWSMKVNAHLLQLGTDSAAHFGFGFGVLVSCSWRLWCKDSNQWCWTPLSSSVWRADLCGETESIWGKDWFQ